jgi:hypothetical protein
MPPAQPAFVPGEDPTRVGGQRLAACAIDVGLGVVLYAIVFVLVSRQAPVATWVGRGTDVCAGRGVSCVTFGHRYADGPRRYVLQLVGLAYLVGVFVLQRGLTGSTLGTRLLGITTVGPDGQPLGPLKALWRSVAGIVDYLPCCIPLVGIVTIFATTGHRRVGDMAARSFVVPRRFQGSPLVIPGIATTALVAAPIAPGFGATSGQPPMPPGPPTGPPAGPVTGAPTSPGAQPYSPPVPPAASAPPPGSPAATPPPPADPTQPQWDADRGAYIQWDQVGQRWMQFDQATQQWGPI